MTKICLLIAFIISAAVGQAEAFPKRIISLSPVGTEILFALGQGGNIAGVTHFCDYPKEALEKPKIGGFAELNLENIIANKTDLLVIQDMHLQFKNDLESLKIPYVVVGQGSVSDICSGIAALGKATGTKQRADAIINEMRSGINDIKQRVKNSSAPRVLISVSRELSEPKIPVFYAAGKNTFYNELIEIAGGKNVLAESKQRAQYPKISQEGLIMLDPDVIIDMVGSKSTYHSMEKVDIDKVFDKKNLTAQWERGARVNAVKNKRIAVLEGTVFLRPGPRMVHILREIARAVHPEIKF